MERVKAGLRNAKSKGKRLGRPHVFVDTRRIAKLREEGKSWPQIADQLGCGVGTAYRAYQAVQLPRVAPAGFTPKENQSEDLWRGCRGLEKGTSA